MNLPRERHETASPLEWLGHAQSDIRLARLAQREEILPEQVCFHAQRAAEKAVKAVLLHKKVDFPFTHDLDELVDVSLSAGIARTAFPEVGPIATAHPVGLRSILTARDACVKMRA